MCVFLCLRDTSLLQPAGCQELAERVCNLFLNKCDQLIRDRHVILCEAYICGLHSLTSVKACKLIVAECPCDLSRAVRPEVKEDNGISVLYCGCRSSVLHYYHGLNELIRLLIVIRRLDAFHRRSSLNTLPSYKRLVSSLHTVPAVVAVHRIVASRNGGHLTHADLLHLCFQLFYILFAGCRGSVTSVQKAMYINFLDTLPLRQLQKSVNVRIVAVYTTVRYEPHQVQRRIILLHIPARGKKRFILEEISILDGLCDLGQILIYDASGAHVQVPHL